VHDVIVIGAGPAGSLTARRLAERGHDVLLLEEHEAIGRPVHCTGLVGTDAFDEFDLPREVILGRAGRARFWGAAGASVPVGADGVAASIIDRGQLDERLAARAAVAGARIETGARVDRLAVEPTAVYVGVRGEEAPRRARLVVLACGANYRFHRQLGLGLPDVFLQSAQLELPFPRSPEVEVRFGRAVAPSGFAWLVPVDRGDVPHARIGLMTETRSLERFQRFLTSLSTRAGVVLTGPTRPRLKILPLGPVARTYGHRVVAVGDAAGLVKPTTGGGIYYGLLSGAIAAPVIDEGLRRNRLDAPFLGRYERDWRRRLGQEIRVGLAFRRLAAGLTDESIDALITLARTDGIVALLQRTASFDWHRKAAVALLGYPAFRKLVLKRWAGASGSA
jgi:geranylgeranyl reductase family protein